MAQFPALPTFTDAILADCDHLTDAELGVYFKILMYMWRTTGCRLPANDAWLARKFRRPVDVFEKEVKPIMQEFCKTDGNWWTQGRLSDEMEWVKKNSKRQSDRSKSRWNNENDKSHGNADVHGSGNAPYPTLPTPSKSIVVSKETTHPPSGGIAEQEEENKSPPKKESPKSAKRATPYSLKFENWWKRYRPTNGSKSEAWVSYQRALNNGATDDILAFGLTEYNKFLDATRTPTAHASTWLNQKRWEVDYRAAIAVQQFAAVPARQHRESPHEVAGRVWGDIARGASGDEEN